MFFVADLRDAIHGFHFADRRLSQLPTPQAASSLSHNHEGHTTYIHEGHTTCCLFTVVMHRGTFQWKEQYENAALDTG